MFKADVEIANICFVLPCLPGNGGCAGVTERRQLHIFCAVFAGGVPCATSRYICVSFIGFIGLYALWLVFNTVSAF